jgi:hypothetical protein
VDQLRETTEGLDPALTAADKATGLLPWNSSRPLDWRWQRAGELLASRARRRRRDDGWVARARRFRAALARARGDDRDPRVARADPALLGARRLARVDRRRRWVLEARLLAGQSDAEVAARMGLGADAVAAYEAVFYAVRDGLGATDWVHLVVIGLGLYDGFDSADEETALKLYGYHLGPLVLDALLENVFTGGRPVADPRLADQLRLALAVQSIEVTPDNAAGVLRLHRLSLDLEREEADLGASAVTGPIAASTGGATIPPRSARGSPPGFDPEARTSGTTAPAPAAAGADGWRLGAAG